MFTPDTPLRDMCIMEVMWVEGSRVDKHLIHKDDAAKFVEAFRALHFKPGVNPHNGGKCAVIMQINMLSTEATGPFWWTTPDLQNNGDPNGVAISGKYERAVWIHPKYRGDGHSGEYNFFRD